MGGGAGLIAGLGKPGAVQGRGEETLRRMVVCACGVLRGVGGWVVGAWGAGDTPTAAEAESALADLSWMEVALNERAELLGRPRLPGGSNDFHRMKTFCRDLLTFFVDFQSAGGGGDFSACLDASAGVWPRLTATGVTAGLNLPTNYFAYTPIPWGGEGGATNGWTAAGGAGLPAGRTFWTAADYGPAGLRRIIGRMTGTIATPFWNGAGGALNVRWTGGESQETWSDCAAYCAANWPEYVYSQNLWPQSETCGYYFGEACYYFRYSKIWNDLEVSGLATQWTHAVDFYVSCGLAVDPYLPTDGEFDDQGVSGLREGFSRVAQMGPDNANRATVRVGDTGNAPLNWCREPDETAMTFRGWEAKRVGAVVRWDVPGGIRY